MKKYLLTAILCAFLKMIHAQDSKALDSINHLIRSSGEDSVRVKAYIYISKLYSKSSKFDSALVNIDKAIALSQKLNSDNYCDKQHLANAFRAKAGLYAKLKTDYRTGIKFYQEYYQISENIKDKSSMGDAQHCIANMYLYMSDYPKALKYYIGSATINQEIGNKKWLANDYTNMAVVYMRQKSYPAARAILTKASDLYAQVHDTEGLIASLKNIGVSYGETKSYDNALKYYFKCEELEKVTPNENLAGTYNNIGIVYIAEKNYNEALKYFIRSHDLLEKYPDDFGMAYCLQGLGTVYFNQKQYALSQEYLLKAADLAKKREMLNELMDDYASLAENYAALKDFTNAYKYRGLQTELKDTIHNSENRDAMAEMQIKFETESKEKEIQLLKTQQDISTLAIEKQRIFIISAIAGILSLLIIVTLVYSRNRTKQRMNDKLERLSLVAKSTDNVVLILDENGKIEWVNESFEKLNGTTIDELKKKKGETIFDISNNLHIREHVNKAITEKRSVDYESLSNNNGKTLWVQSTLTPVFNQKNELQRLIIVDTNITQRKMDELLIQEKNKDIIDSINYAKRIQDAILPSIENHKIIFPESFILYKPRDIVSGDFYWYAEKDGKKIIAAVDCTGHGVPGALMSMIGNAFLNEIVNKQGITNPGAILSELRHLVITTLKQSSNAGENKDGMDIALISFDNNTKTLEYAGANNPLWIITSENGEKKLIQVKPNKRPIGYFQGKGLPFTNNVVEHKADDVIYIFTDGFADQFGGAEGKKFKYKQLQEKFLSIHQEPFEKQKEMLDTIFEKWKGNLEQVDDMLVIGVKFS